MDSIDLVGCDYERRLGLLEDAQRLDGLRPRSLHHIDDQDGDVC